MYSAGRNAYDSQRIAKFVAAFVTFGCLGFFILVARPENEPPLPHSSVPAATPRPWTEPDPNQKFRAVPARWASIDFKDYFYGRYKLVDGKKIFLNLTNGEYEYDFGAEGRGWFSLHDVYYFDVTGDDFDDAIVDISHVECGVSCDGGSDMLFIFSINAAGRVTELFRYDTGSYAYGCGLKSMTLARKEVSLELFGRCPHPKMEDAGPGKYLVKDVTYHAFWFSEKGFIETKTEYVATGVSDVTNFEPQVRIHEEPSNVIRP